MDSTPSSRVTADARTRDLSALFDPRGVVLVGASGDPTKWGYQIAVTITDTAPDHRPLHFVNQRRGTVLGRQVHTSIDALPDDAEPDLVVVAVPAHSFLAVVDDALAAGARAIVGITAGLGEKGGELLELEREVAARVRAKGAVLVGPNCMGVGDTNTSLSVGWGHHPKGPVYTISQSGNLLGDITAQLGEMGLGASRHVSVGNQADLAIADFVADAATDPATSGVAVYVEDFRDGRHFVEAAREVVASGRPVGVLTPLSSAASARSAASHTGALLTDHRAIEAACRAAGVQLVTTTTELVAVMQAAVGIGMQKGRRVYVFGDGGGNVTIASGLVSNQGLDLPLPSPELHAKLSELLPSTSSVGNPTDLSGASERDMNVYVQLLDIVAASGEFDVAVGTGGFGGYSRTDDNFGRAELETARTLVATADQRGLPLLLQTPASASPTMQVLRGGGIPVYRDIGRLVGALAAIAPETVAAAPTHGESHGEAKTESTSSWLSYDESRRRLAGAGLRFPASVVVASAGAAEGAAAGLTYPLVVKDTSNLHKSDGGGVRLGIRDEVELLEIVRVMFEERRATSISIEEEVDRASGHEMLLGARRDPQFGTLLLVGMGGTLTEVLDDVTVVLPPVDADTIRQAVASLRLSRLLGGFRGRPAIDQTALTEAAAALVAQMESDPDIAEVEINPLLVGASAAIGLDARIVLEGGA